MFTGVHAPIKLSEKNIPETFLIPSELNPADSDSLWSYDIKRKVQKKMMKNQFEVEYSFSEIVFEKSFITFLLDSQVIKFTILKEVELEKCDEVKTLTGRQVHSFLTILDEKLLLFLIEELNVIKDYLFEFLETDLIETVEILLTDGSKNPNLHSDEDDCLKYLHDTQSDLKYSCEELTCFARSLKETDVKKRIRALCAKKFRKEFFSDTEQSAKAQICSLMGCSAFGIELLPENLSILAEVLVLYDNEKLIKHMQRAVENPRYNLKGKLYRLDIDMQKRFVVPTELAEALLVGNDESVDNNRHAQNQQRSLEPLVSIAQTVVSTQTGTREQREVEIPEFLHDHLAEFRQTQQIQPGGITAFNFSTNTTTLDDIFGPIPDTTNAPNLIPDNIASSSQNRPASQTRNDSGIQNLEQNSLDLISISDGSDQQELLNRNILILPENGETINLVNNNSQYDGISSPLGTHSTSMFGESLDEDSAFNA